MWSSDIESLFLNQNLILSLNTEDVLRVILTIERENALKPNFSLMSFKHLLPVNWNIEIMYSPFITQIKVKRRNNLAIMQMPF